MSSATANAVFMWQVAGFIVLTLAVAALIILCYLACDKLVSIWRKHGK